MRLLTRLRSLQLSAMPLPSDAYPSLTALSGRLRTLALTGCVALPACLPDLSSLEALCITDYGRLMDNSQGEPAAILTAALSQLTGLTRLAIVIPPHGAAAAATLLSAGPAAWSEFGPANMKLPAQHRPWDRGWSSVQLDLLAAEEVQATLQVGWVQRRCTF